MCHIKLLCQENNTQFHSATILSIPPIQNQLHVGRRSAVQREICKGKDDGGGISEFRSPKQRIQTKSPTRNEPGQNAAREGGAG